MTDYDRRHYEFSRMQTDGLHLENSGPAIEPWWKSILAGALVAFAIAVYFVVWG